MLIDSHSSLQLYTLPYFGAFDVFTGIIITKPSYHDVFNGCRGIDINEVNELVVIQVTGSIL